MKSHNEMDVTGIAIDPKRAMRTLNELRSGLARRQRWLTVNFPLALTKGVHATLSEMGVAGSFSYVAIKHAVVGMMRAAQQDLSGRGVHSCCVCPGLTSTQMLPLNFQNAAAFARERVSMRRLWRPGEIADLIAFASENPSINGAVLHANLGQIQR